MAKSYLERKEAWARRMKERGLGMVTPRSDNRLPPGQHEVKHLPVLDLGEHPPISTERWRLELSGHVEKPTALTWDALQQLPRKSVRSDFHCVTTWSHFDCVWEGVSLETLLEHGAPARIIVPRLYAWKGAKFVRSMEFLNEERLGYWEVRGYSNTADPWTNDRFSHGDQLV